METIDERALTNQAPLPNQSDCGGGLHKLSDTLLLPKAYLLLKEFSHEIATVGALYWGAVAVSFYSCAGPFTRTRNNIREVGRTNIIRCLEELGRHVDRSSHDRSP